MKIWCPVITEVMSLYVACLIMPADTISQGNLCTSVHSRVNVETTKMLVDLVNGCERRNPHTSRVVRGRAFTVGLMFSLWIHDDGQWSMKRNASDETRAKVTDPPL
jgi:hypothetical protein